MAVAYVTHPAYIDHHTGQGHPERPERLRAVDTGIQRAGLDTELVRVVPEPASRADIERVHAPAYVEALERFCRAGGGMLDGDTVAVPASWNAALLAAGAGLTAVEKLRHGDDEVSAAFCAVRPPGHHALRARAMGFCLFNNVAITAACLAARGERVMIVDIDAHHGNGTQEAFYSELRVAYVSFHQHPLYPGTGALEETGDGPGRGTIVNLPLPRGSTGDVYRAGVAEIVAPLFEHHQADWLLVSAGFDGHRADPLTDLGLSAGDYADITRDLVQLASPGRVLLFLEGGYDMEALCASAAGMFAALGGETLHTETPTHAGPGREIVSAAMAAHERARG
jgi:acetoin utilization deacetylase AcuC-like enzyme